MTHYRTKPLGDGRYEVSRPVHACYGGSFASKELAQAEADRLNRVEAVKEAGPRLLAFVKECANDRHDCISPMFKEKALELMASVDPKPTEDGK